MIRKQLLVEEFKMSSSLLEIIGGRPIENNEKEGSSSCSCSCLVFSAVESHNRSIR